MTRVCIISDTHCGSQVGLTPPKHQLRCIGKDVAKHNKFYELQRQCWGFFIRKVREMGRPDVLIVNGDAIDGRGDKTHGVEQITTDRNKQCDMAVECIQAINARHIVMTYGTPYHTGEGEDYEDIIAERVKAEKIGAHEWINVHGQIFDIKHKIGSSSVPYGRHTAVSREWVWNALWAERKEQPRATIIIRSHVHYYGGAFGPGWMGLTTPALQAMGSRYGARQCSGQVHFGLVVFDIDKKGRYTWHAEVAEIQAQRARVLTLS